MQDEFDKDEFILDAPEETEDEEEVEEEDEVEETADIEEEML